MRKVSLSLSAERFVTIFLIILFTSVLVSNYEFIKFKITSWASFAGLGVFVEPITELVITQVDLEPVLDLGQNQYIFVEIANTGTTTVTAKIEVHISRVDGGRLNLTASYYDSTVILVPGTLTTSYNKRQFNITFRPPTAGLYYVRIRVPYGVQDPYVSKVTQTWESFLVFTTGPVTPTTIIVGAPRAVGAVLGPASALVEAPNNITIIQGEYGTFDLTVKNVGDKTLNNLKLYISSPTALNLTTSPKIIKSLGLNSSTLFLITIGAPMETELGVYPIEIDFKTDELKESKSVDVYVISSNASIIAYIEGLIANYEYLISRIYSQIYNASLEGYDVTLANESLNNARSSLQIAKKYFELQEFDYAKRELRTTLTYLEDAVFQLANAMLYVYRPPAFYPYLVIIIEVFIVIIIFVIFYLERRRKKKPKSLRAAVRRGE